MSWSGRFRRTPDRFPADQYGSRVERIPQQSLHALAAPPQRRTPRTPRRSAADVIGPTTQGIEPGAFAELVRAMRAGVTYTNVHSTKFPAGEIRGQINDTNQRQP
jgi:hypothetical protein